ncbi:MAG: hypothetical protein ACYTGL_18115 [Planctomycetota bacterium]|jgi:hypothetical protein
MRLTLRTLLAYLDDILEPAQAREIGAKISESGYASSLVEHVREVMRQRRLGAPDASGPGIGLDPNSVAEYLDNTLTPEEVADIEKICLESDLHLAEVAACHQILTIVLGEPVDVSEHTRERMYALGTSSHAVTADEDSKSNGEPRKPVPPVSGPAKQPTASEFAGVPEYLKPAPTWRRAGPMVAGLVIGCVWLMMIWSSPSLNRSATTPDGSQVADATGSQTNDTAGGIADSILADGEVTLNEAGLPENSEPEPQDAAPDDAMPENRLESTASAPSIQELNGFDPPPPADAPEPAANVATTTPSPRPATTATTTPDATPATVPRTTEPTTVAAVTPGRPTSKLPVLPDESTPAPTAGTDTPPAKPTQPPAAPVAEPPAEPEFGPAPDILYASRDGIFLSRNSDGWRAMPRRTVLHDGDALAAPEPFASVLDITSLGLTIEVFGGTAFEVLGSTDEDALVLRLIQGRLAIQSRVVADPDKPAAVGIQVGKERFHLVFPKDNSVCGIEVVPTEPERFEEPPAEDQFVGHLFVARGSVTASSDGPGGRMLNAPAWLPLTVSVRRQMEQASENLPILPVPEWLDLDGDRLSPAKRRYASRFEKELDPDVPVHLSVPAVVNSQVPDLSELAVKCLGITGLTEQLVEALSRTEFTESRQAAAQAIRQWLPRDPANKETLRQALTKNFGPDEVDPIYRLLWGYNESDAQNEATSRILVDWLRHDSDVIRQLAYFHIYRLTGQRYDYRPNNPKDQRRAALKRWEAHLGKHDGKLVP